MAEENPIQILKMFNSITIGDATGRDQTLYFGSAPSTSFHADDYELPPQLPWQSFDVRFGSGGLVEVVSGGTREYPISVQSDTYPLTVHWHFAQSSVRGVSLIDEESRSTLGVFTGTDGTFCIESPASSHQIGRAHV